MKTNTNNKKNTGIYKYIGKDNAHLNKVNMARKHYCPNIKQNCDLVVEYGRANFVSRLKNLFSGTKRSGWIEIK